MSIGLVGRKCGMTRVFTDAGETLPVTVIEVLPNRVTQVKNAEKDGYRAVQVTFGKRKQSRLTKPVAGHYAKVKVAPGKAMVEFRLSPEEAKPLLRAFPTEVPSGVGFMKRSGLVSEGRPEEFEALAGRCAVFRFDPV